MAGYGPRMELTAGLLTLIAGRAAEIVAPWGNSIILYAAKSDNKKGASDMKYPDMDIIYRTRDPEDIPWNIAQTPEPLVKLVEAGKLRPCKAIDFGCGTGNYAIYLASRGFEVTGIDISPSAIRIARENAEKKRVQCNFIVADALGDLHELNDTFDFAYDWELLHHIFPEDREQYVKNVYSVLNPNGIYLSVCFSEEDPFFGGSGKFRKTPLGTILYFSSEQELSDLFSQFFNVLEMKTIDIAGKPALHRAVYAWMEKR